MSGYASGGQWAVPCPKCGARPNETCRTLTTRRATDTHVARIDAWLARPWSADEDTPLTHPNRPQETQ